MNADALNLALRAVGRADGTSVDIVKRLAKGSTPCLAWIGIHRHAGGATVYKVLAPRHVVMSSARLVPLLEEEFEPDGNEAIDLYGPFEPDRVARLH